MPKENLKDKLDGNELDLSLSNLSAIPVKELACIPKATRLDISCNLLSSIPDEFCALTHIVKLDISKNQLLSLPASFGRLSNLQHLDLYANKLTTLPVSFSQLRSLRWLDLKDNPLQDTLAKVSGDCLDENQCRKCAKSVIAFMKEVQSEQDRQIQKTLQQQRAQESAVKAAEDKERSLKREEKKRLKDQRRRDHELVQKQKEKQDRDEVQNRVHETETDSKDAQEDIEITRIKSQEKPGHTSCCGMLMIILLGAALIVVGLLVYCNMHPGETMCRQLTSNAEKYYHKITERLYQFQKNMQTLTKS